MEPQVFKRAGTPLAIGGAAQPATTNSFERKPTIEVDGSHKIDGGVEAVDVDRGIAGMALANDKIELDVERRIDANALSIERFMAEELDVVLNDPASETEPQFVEIRVNGDYVIARRDSQFPVKMKRYHVAILAQSKTATLRQTKRTDHEGFQSYKEEVVLRQSYPFSVLHDPSGSRGAAWLRPLITGATV